MVDIMARAADPQDLQVAALGVVGSGSQCPQVALGLAVLTGRDLGAGKVLKNDQVIRG
jgi:hypothetical protein